MRGLSCGSISVNNYNVQEQAQLTVRNIIAGFSESVQVKANEFMELWEREKQFMANLDEIGRELSQETERYLQSQYGEINQMSIFLNTSMRKFEQIFYREKEMITRISKSGLSKEEMFEELHYEVDALMEEIA